MALTNAFQAVTGQITAQTAGNELEVILERRDGRRRLLRGSASSFTNGTAPPPPTPNAAPAAAFTVSSRTDAAAV